MPTDLQQAIENQRQENEKYEQAALYTKPIVEDTVENSSESEFIRILMKIHHLMQMKIQASEIDSGDENSDAENESEISSPDADNNSCIRN